MERDERTASEQWDFCLECLFSAEERETTRQGLTVVLLNMRQQPGTTEETLFLVGSPRRPLSSSISALSSHFFCPGSPDSARHSPGYLVYSFNASLSNRLLAQLQLQHRAARLSHALLALPARIIERRGSTLWKSMVVTGFGRLRDTTLDSFAVAVKSRGYLDLSRDVWLFRAFLSSR